MRKLKIFVSSTILELHDERIVLKNDFNIRGIDTFVFESDVGARPESAQQSFLAELTDSDLYIGIFWNQFSEATIKEFKHARAIGKSCLVYVKNFHVNRDPKLETFLNQIGEPNSGITFRYFNNILELIDFTRQDVQSWLVREWRQKSEKPIFPMDKLDRLQNDFINLLNLCQTTDTMKIVESEGTPPVKYVVEYSVKGIAGLDEFNNPIYSNRHLVEFRLHEGYPMNLPFTKFLTPIFHPNVFSGSVFSGSNERGVICIGWSSLPYQLSYICIIVAMMINYQIYNVRSSSNHEAAVWAKNHPNLFPLDKLVLQGENQQFVDLFSAE